MLSAVTLRRWPVRSSSSFSRCSRAPRDSAFIEKNARGVALLTTLVTFAPAIVVMIQFDPQNPGFQMVEYTCPGLPSWAWAIAWAWTACLSSSCC